MDIYAVYSRHWSNVVITFMILWRIYCNMWNIIHKMIHSQAWVCFYKWKPHMNS